MCDDGRDNHASGQPPDAAPPRSNSSNQKKANVERTLSHPTTSSDSPKLSCQKNAIENNSVLSIAQDSRQGSHAIVADDQTLTTGQILLECPSASIALDPLYRQSHCGFCANEIQQKVWGEKNNSNISEDPTISNVSATCCQGCHLIAICPNCHDHGATDWHSSSGECGLLQTLLESFRDVIFGSSSGEDDEETVTMDLVSQQIESIYIITMRLLLRRHLQQQSIEAAAAAACPLPKIDWSLFDTLYSSPLTTTTASPSSTNDASSFVAVMAALLQVMNTRLLQKRENQKREQSSSRPLVAPTMVLNPHDCIDVFGKCRGCCHAITDLSRPLGAQNLGMALFLPHSFYNHACAPNAFLSCLLPRDNINDTNDSESATAVVPCAVTARVVCWSQQPVQPGESVTLSYIPLSGLCRRERQMRLRDSYHFICECTVCQENSKEGSAIELAVGGDFAAGVTQDDELMAGLTPLRELQLDCYQKLISTSTTETKADNTETIEDPRMDLIEQCMATLQMAQRGIKNQQIPASHEVSLECHRLLAMAHALLRNGVGDEAKQAMEKEWHHQEHFFLAAESANSILDPSALAIQHKLAAECLQTMLEGDTKHSERSEMQQKLLYHSNAAKDISRQALGEDHPFVRSVLELSCLNQDTLASSSRKRKAECKTNEA